LSTNPAVTTTDQFPLQLTKKNLSKWLQDIVSPFYIFSRLHYESSIKAISSDFLNTTIQINSKQILQFLSIKKTIQQSAIEIKDARIYAFTFYKNNQQIKALCIPKEY
jgi:predicted Zn-dependent protease